MSEAKALALACVGLAIPFSAVVVLIMETNRSGVLLGLAVGLFAALGGWITAGVVGRYDEQSERKKREEVILSR